MSSIFSKIVTGDIPSYKIAEDDNHLAFLDIFPIKKGHTLVIPKKEIEKLFDLTKEEYISLQEFTYKVSKALEKTIPCNRVGMMVLGFEIPHAHIHLVPIDHEKEMDISNDKIQFTKEEFINIANKIKENYIG